VCKMCNDSSDMNTATVCSGGIVQELSSPSHRLRGTKLWNAIKVFFISPTDALYICLVVH
jgi:hypothetical protein